MKISIKRMMLVLLISTSVFTAMTPVFAEKPVEKSASNQEKSQLININTAGAKELTKGLKGIGMKKAQAIVTYREANGKFKNTKDLLNVKGVGNKILEQNMGRLTI